MNAEEKNEIAVDIETLMDNQEPGVSGLLSIIAEICSGRAEHLRANYPEEKQLARTWDRLAQAMSKAENIANAIP